MSQKQEIYREILRWALPSSRNSLAQFRQVRWWRILSPKKQREFREAYEVAQLVHNLYVSILEEEFTSHDIWFLNVHARSFIKEDNDKTCRSYSMFAYHLQELFRIVPDNLRDQLEWTGPEGDYEWARPRKGSEV